MLVLHANWYQGSMRLWAESLSAFVSGPPRFDSTVFSMAEGGGAATLEAAQAVSTPRPHWFALDSSVLVEAVSRHLESADLAPDLATPGAGFMPLRLPATDSGPLPSDRLSGNAGAADLSGERFLQAYEVPCLNLDPASTISLLLRLDSTPADDGVLEYSHGLRYWFDVGRLLTRMLVHQRFIPTLVQSRGGGLRAHWQPWFHDEQVRGILGKLVSGMPPICRAVVDESGGRPWSVLSEAVETLIDRTIRRTLLEEEFDLALEGRDPQEDSHVAWLSGLLAAKPQLDLGPAAATELLRGVGSWVSRLDETSPDQPLRLSFWLQEPPEEQLESDAGALTWRLRFCLSHSDDPSNTIDASQIWEPGGAVLQSIDRPDELLLTELARAARLYPALESALTEARPTGLDLSTADACRFIQEFRPILEESGVGVRGPDWWDEPENQIGARLHVESGSRDRSGSGLDGKTRLGLNSLVRYQWQIAVGDQPLTEEEFDRLRQQMAPLVRLRGRWVRLEADQVEAALRLVNDAMEGEASLLEAMHMAHGLSGPALGLPITGMDATGWVKELLTDAGQQRIQQVEQPKLFRGDLRPYQRGGLSWLAFLDRFGLGACLADDMGLGKTIQLIALLQLERQEAGEDDAIGPTLLLVPTSLIGNWTREIERFAPELEVLVQHGSDRLVGRNFLASANACDVVITTYGLVSRDKETLGGVQWHRVVLDEAQFIKNPPTKQARAIRSLPVRRRIAMTGTPVENRLSELWSIMEFCNPGYLGPAGEFRRRFAVPIERRGDQRRAAALRQLVGPFVLRRLKTDPTVIDDLPPCVETKEYAHLTPHQAALYQKIVTQMLSHVESSEGIRRRGLVLSSLTKLKQICNHPALLSDSAVPGVRPTPDEAPLVMGSGKSRRLIRMLEEVVASGDSALIFTQFRRMGHLLTSMVEHELDCEALFLHGGTPPSRRQQLIDRFQDPADRTPVFVLSLKAGGIGLNLTAATHVFHFDRWWNPAVENQATDRAFRIGQTRTVHVHKFVCVGTLEERIDQMIEQKTELADHIIGSGEQWLTELSTLQLRDVLALRDTALEMDS